MDLNENVRWQHIVLIAAGLALVLGGAMFAYAVAQVGPNPPPWWVGVLIFIGGACAGTLSLLSLRAERRRSTNMQELARGAFEFSSPVPAPWIRLNARLATHFGLSQASNRPSFPPTFGLLVEAIAKRARAEGTIQPAQLQAARTALGSALRKPPESISWAANPIQLIPSGRAGFALWERLRKDAPLLPPATLNPWVEKIAIYGFLAALIAIAVPIAQQLDKKDPSLQHPTIGVRFVAKAFGLALFGSVIGVAMIPVYIYGPRYAARFPAGIDQMGALAQCFPKSNVSEWTTPLVAEHLRDLVSTELALSPSSLREDTSIHPTPAG